MPQWDALALQLRQRIQQAGYECVIVGGAVRDLLRGQTPVDYDLACSAPPEQLLTLLPSAHATGGPYGTVTVCRSDAGGVHQYEITPFRAEEGYSDGRHPDHVRCGVSLQEDLARRDFTVNAMAWDGSRVIDPFGGQADLSARLIRTVGDPSRRFQEDGLRILRALRFASALSFALYHTAMMLGWFSPPLFLLALAGLAAGGVLFDLLDAGSGTIFPSWAVHIFANLAINTVGFILFKIL